MDVVSPVEQPGDADSNYCRVCYEDLSPGGGTLRGPLATALRECRHWFCDTCWRAHLSVAARELGPDRRMECPEFRCGVEVDSGTLLSLLPVRDVIMQQRRGVERRLTRMFRSKWCPNPQCGRVVQLTDRDPQNVVAEPTSMACPCGQRFCFRCHHVPHWPLSCDDLVRYHARLRKSGDLATTAPPSSQLSGMVVVRGKPCPRCYVFIEKQGGCPCMTCICGHNFWWCCRKSVRSDKPHVCGNYITVNDLTNTVKRVIKHVDTAQRGSHTTKRSSLYYELAVHHRVCQHPKEMRRVGERAEDLRRKLQLLCRKGVDIGVVPLPLATGLCCPSSSAGALSTTVTMSKRPDRDTDTPPRTATNQEDAVLTDAEIIRDDCETPRVDPDHNGVSVSTRPKKKLRGRVRHPSTENSLVATSSSSSPHGGAQRDHHARQHVKHATVAMTKLKIEVHHVLEHTAALLDLHEDDGGRRSSEELLSPVARNKAKVEVERLVFLLSSLDLLLDAHSPRELRRALPWFRCVQRDVKDSMTTLARLFASQTRRGP